jgi:hypothetical protein
MVVKAQCIGHRIIGLYVGAKNVRQYFPRHIANIDLQLDHLRIQCGLTPHFWKDLPEIHDSRLCDWLESKQLHGWGELMALEMIPTGENSFILGPMSLDEHKSAGTGAAAAKQAELTEARVPAWTVPV